MIIKVVKHSEEAKTPVSANKISYELYSTKITTEIGEDAKLVIVYHTDLAIDVPEGYIALLIPRNDIFKKSIGLTNSVQVFLPGGPHMIEARFKANTDVVPSVYKVGEAFAQLALVASPAFEIEETVAEIKSEKQTEDTTEE